MRKSCVTESSKADLSRSPSRDRLRFAEFFHGARSFKGDGDQGAQGLERFAGKQRPGNRQAPQRPRTHAHRREAKTALPVQQRLLAQGGAPHLLLAEVRGGARMIELVFVVQIERGRAHAKGLHDMIGHGVEQGDHVSGYQELLAELV